MALTPKQERFVAEYMVDLNGTQAAIRAGYSEKTANEQASRLLANVKIADAVAKKQQKRAERTDINAAWLLNRLAEEATADAADLYDEEGHLKPIKDWPMIWRQGLVAGFDVEEISDGENTIGVLKKIKLSDRIKRLELIGKHVGVQAFREALGISAPDGGPIQVEQKSWRERLREEK